MGRWRHVNLCVLLPYPSVLLTLQEFARRAVESKRDRECMPGHVLR